MAFTLDSFDAPEQSGPDTASPIVVAGDTHNLANNGTSFWDDPLEAVSNIPKFIGLGVASAVNQVYNIAPTIGNWFGGDFEQNKLADTIASFDSDLSKYYKSHQEGIDALGFAISSLVPGTAGVKALRAGQVAIKSAAETGVIGANFSRATGLLIPSVEKNVLNATEQLIKGSSPFKLQQSEVLKALGAGFGQNILEGAAFEVAVAATMYNSPVLENQDLGDMFSNIIWGAGLYGAIGGVLTGVHTVSAIKKGVGAFDETASPWTHIETGKINSSPADNILIYNEQRLSMPSVVPGVQYDTKLLELGKKKQGNLETLMRGEFQKLTGDDSILADSLFKNLLKQDSKSAVGNLWQLDEAVRLTAKTSGEKLLSKALGGKANLAEVKLALDHSEAYLINRGPNAGKIQKEIPASKTLADTISADTPVTLSAKGIKIGNKPLVKISASGFDIFKASTVDAEIRTAWAREHFKPIDSTIIESTDIPLLDAAYEQISKGEPIPFIKVGDITFKPTTSTEFLTTLSDIKMSTAGKLFKGKKLPIETIARLVNTNEDFLVGKQTGSLVENLFSDLKELTDYNIRNNSAFTNTLEIPSVIKLSYKKSNVAGMDGHLLAGMEAVYRQQRLYQDGADRAVTAILGEDVRKLIPIPMEEITKATRLGAGATFTSFASSNYGTLGSKFEWLGKVTTDIIANKKVVVKDVLEPLLYKLQNDSEAAIEWSKLTQTIRGSEFRWKLGSEVTGNGTKDDIVTRYLTLADDKEIAKLFKAGHEIPRIEFKSKIVSDLAAAHTELNSTRVNNLSVLRASQGLESNLKADTFYVPPPNPKDYPFFAFVVDPTITGTGHSKMLYAATEAELKIQMSAVRGQFPDFKVLEKGEAEKYYKAVGKFDYEKTLNENYIDIAINRKGTSAQFLIKTDPKQISDELFQWHLNAEAGVVRETVSHKYEPQFEALRKLGEQYTLAATSKYGGLSLTKYAENTVENPYTDYIKTALGINKASEYPFWMPVQKMLDNKVSQLFSNVWTAAKGIKSGEDLAAINTKLLEAGYQGAYYDAALNLAVNSKIPKGLLTEYVQQSNGLLSLFALRLDPLNALNNIIGSGVLLNTEIRSLLRDINKGNSEGAGELAKLMKLQVPGTEGREVLTHGKLVKNAINNFFSSDKVFHKFYADNNFTTDIRTQYLSSLDSMALKGTESVSELSAKKVQLVETAKKYAALGEKATGNAIAEEFNRFVAADVMRQITDTGIKAGVLDSRSALSYINTFVNRTQGNFLAAQRPMLFQGPVGQAVGLFQTYQFNLIQQLFRHVAEGSKKDTAMLLGLQGSIYGMNGLPAFNAINTHIIGNASGNKDHKDLYTAVYGGAGQAAGDWLMYGLASNMFLAPELKINMYSRGDINPRHATIIPTNPADVPFINAQTKFIGNLWETFGKLGDGGNVASVFLQGIEHNGISRPLAGLAQTMQAFVNPNNQVVSTNNKGNVVGSHDLFSLMTLGRLAGGKPLDEAIATDTLFKLRAYGTADSDRIAKLGEVVKSSYLGGGAPDSEQLTVFMEKYVEAGGKQSGFNKFIMKQNLNATKSQAEQVRDTLNKPYSKTLQSIMGGFDPTAEASKPQDE